MNKLQNFPSVYYVTLEDCTDRQEKIENEFAKYGIILNRVKSKRFSKSNDCITGKYIYQLTEPTRGCIVSHLKAIKKWYDSEESDYAFFCEDDLSLRTVDYWNFTWQEFIEKLPKDWECIQLMAIRGDFDGVYFRDRKYDDWSQTAYILNRDYAKKLIDNYCIGNTFHLEIKNLNIMPIGENILFTNIGKVYTFPMFVENVDISTTDINDLEIEDGQKPNHIYSSEYVHDWWKTQGINSNIETLMNNQKTKLEKLLINYALNPENPETNFALGLWYEREGHTAPALSYFLRCAERDKDIDIQYLALIKCHYCYDRQGTRDGTSKSLLLQAITILPKRPEAHFLLSKFYEKRNDWSECYACASLALEVCDFDCEPLLVNVEYPGYCGLLFEKAISGWWWGKNEESKNILLDLKNNYTLDEQYQKSVDENLIKLGIDFTQEEIETAYHTIIKNIERDKKPLVIIEKPKNINYE